MCQRGVRRARHSLGRRGGIIKSEVNEAGRAKEVRAHPVIFVSTLFEIDISEEICGRFGSFDGSASTYRATRAFVR